LEKRKMSETEPEITQIFAIFLCDDVVRCYHIDGEEVDFEDKSRKEWLTKWQLEKWERDAIREMERLRCQMMPWRWHQRFALFRDEYYAWAIVPNEFVPAVFDLIGMKRIRRKYPLVDRQIDLVEIGKKVGFDKKLVHPNIPVRFYHGQKYNLPMLVQRGEQGTFVLAPIVLEFWEYRDSWWGRFKAWVKRKFRRKYV
jgi:hypothetical protein